MLDVGGVRASLGATFDGDGFDRFEQRLKRVRHEAADDVVAHAKVNADTKGLDRYRRGLQDVGHEHENFVRGSGRVRGALGGLFIGGAGIAAAGVAFTGLARGVGAVTSAYEESAKIGRQTTAVLKSTGDASHVTAQHVGELATALSNKTGIDDEAIQSGENLLLTFTNIRNEAGKGNDIFDQSTKILTDMSAALGQDTSSSAIQLGKALNDPIKGVTALQRVGVSFTQSQRDQIKTLVEHGNTVKAQKLILHELNREFGGTAAATATGTDRMRVALGNLAEWIGGKINPLVTKAANFVTKLVNSFINGGHATQGFTRGLSTVVRVAGQLVTGFIAAARGVINFLRTNDDVQRIIGQVRRTFAALVTFLGHVFNDARRIFRGILPDLKTIASTVLSVFRRVQDYIQPVARAVLPGLEQAFHGLFVVIRNVVGLIAAIFRGDFTRIWKSLKGIVSGALGAALGVIRGMFDGFKTAGGKLFGAVGEGIKGAIGGVLSVAEGFVNRIIDVINVLPGVNIGHVGGGAPIRGYTPSGQALRGNGPSLGGFPGRSARTSSVGAYYAGGVVDTPMMIVGEEAPAHPEVIIPSNPAYRSRALGLFAAAGRMLGVPGFALGGIRGALGDAAHFLTGGAIKLGKTAVGLASSLIGDLPGNPFTGAFAGMGHALIDAIGSFITGKAKALPHEQPPVAAGGKDYGGLAPIVLRAIAWARSHGWRGVVSSGYRSPAEQAYLWEHRATNPNPVAPPGTSEHERGTAIDVTDIPGFLRAMQSAPANAHLIWGGSTIGDPVHFSIDGHARGAVIGRGAMAAMLRAGIPGYKKGKGPDPIISPRRNRRMHRAYRRHEHGLANFEQSISDLERIYGQRDREFGLTDEQYLVQHDDGSVTIDARLQGKREHELTNLIGLRKRIKRTIHHYHGAAERAVKSYRHAVTRLTKALGKAKGKNREKERARYRDSITTYKQRIGDLRGVIHDLPYDERDSGIDLEELRGELHDVTHAKPTAADAAAAPTLESSLTPAETAALPGLEEAAALAGTTPDQADDETARAALERFYRGVLARLRKAGAPPSVITDAATALQQYLPASTGASGTTTDPAAGVAAALASFRSAGTDLFTGFGSNFMPAGRGLSSPTDLAAGPGNYGAGRGELGDPVVAAGGQGIVQHVYITGPQPADPHTFTQAALHELRAAAV